MARRLEREISSQASALTLVEGYFDIVNAADTPTIVIRNGVDDADLARLDPPPPPTDLLRLSYVGTLYGEQEAAPVFDALARLARSGRTDLARFCIRVVGNDWRRPSDRRWPEPVEALGHVSHREALREMCSASALLHYVPAASRRAAGKLYEYLASGRPILCVVRPDGGAAELVRAAGAGPIAAPDDPHAIEEAILSLYERWGSTGLPDQPHAREWVLANYSRRKLTGDLAAVLDQVASG